MDLQQLMRGMQMGGMGAPAADPPSLDTAEQVYISSLPLLKMLKHGWCTHTPPVLCSATPLSQRGLRWRRRPSLPFIVCPCVLLLHTHVQSLSPVRCACCGPLSCMFRSLILSLLSPFPPLFEHVFVVGSVAVFCFVVS